MNFDTIDEALNSLMDEFQYAYASKLIDTNHTASGNLALNQKHYFVSDYAKNGELFDYILYIKKGFDEDISSR